ncbi:MAG: ATPase [Leuconostoc mesenteroides]|jgi:predicted ABC-type ATPase
MKKSEYMIVAGINGAGKSTLYRLQPELFDNTERINADEILQNMGGDWRKKLTTLDPCVKKLSNYMNL